MKINSLIIILIIMASGTGYVLGQSPIASFKEEISQIETENQALQSQVVELTESNTNLIESLENITANLTSTQIAFQALLGNYDEITVLLMSTQFDIQDLLADFEDLEVKFTEAQVNNSVLLSLYSSLWEKYIDLVVAYNDLTSGPPLDLTEYIRNSDFDDPIIFDPDFNIPYWYEPGSGGWIAFSGSSGRTGRAICPHPGKIIQKLDLPSMMAILTFWVLPNPNNNYSTINVFFDEELIYEETYTGSIDDYDWQMVTIYLDINQGTHYLTFEVLTSNTVRIDDVSLVG